MVQEIIGLVGKTRTERLLIINDVAPSTAGKLVRGKYESQIGELLAEKIERAREAAKTRAS